MSPLHFAHCISKALKFLAMDSAVEELLKSLDRRMLTHATTILLKQWEKMAET